MVRLKGIHHLAMATKDMEGTIRFWRDLLGMRLVGGLGKKGYKLYFFEICPQNYVVFFEWPNVEPVAEKDHGFPVSGSMVFDHVSFAVEDDQVAVRAAGQAGCGWLMGLRRIDHGIIDSIYAFDPNGYPDRVQCPGGGRRSGSRSAVWSSRCPSGRARRP